MVFFAIWWAWMNYTWFASAYDSDDVVFRLLTFTIMTGSLMLAAGVPDLFDDGQSGVVVAGYAVMRLGMVALWLRAARSHPEGRRTALTYAVGIAVVQALWIARLVLDGQAMLMSTFFLLVLAELAVPVIAERRGGPTPFHAHHIAERFGLFTIIVLGEVILASVQAIQGALAAPPRRGVGRPCRRAGGSAGLSASLVMLIVGGLLLVFSLWWLYFKREHVDLIGQGRRADVGLQLRAHPGVCLGGRGRCRAGRGGGRRAAAAEREPAHGRARSRDVPRPLRAHPRRPARRSRPRPRRCCWLPPCSGAASIAVALLGSTWACRPAHRTGRRRRIVPSTSSPPTARALLTTAVLTSSTPDPARSPRDSLSPCC